MSNLQPPNDKTLESSLLGIIMLFPETIHQVRGLLTADDFYNLYHREIWEVYEELTDQHVAIDFVSVGRRLKKVLRTELSRMTDNAVTKAHVIDIAKQIKALSAQRKVLTAAHEIVRSGYKKQHNVEQFLSTSLSKMVAATATNTGDNPLHIADGMSDVTKLALEGGTAVAFQPTGILPLDGLIAGLPKGVYTALGGRPSMGKSSVALHIGIYTAAKVGNVLCFSLEDRTNAVQSRVLSNLSGIPYFDINMGKVPIDLGGALMQAQSHALKLPFFIEDRKLTVEEISQKAIAFKATVGDVKLVIIDHLTYIANSKRHQYMSKYEAVSDKVRAVSYLAGELGCPLLLCCQLNRKLESREDKRPGLGDLRDSGQIEEDARMVIFTYRDSVYDENADPRACELIVAKNTNGPCGVANVDFQKEICRVT